MASKARLPAGPLRVAYHQGPPQIHFFNRHWQRGDAQEVSAQEWSEMRARGDCAQFEFKPAPAAADSASTED